jgi:hypothetical protein
VRLISIGVVVIGVMTMDWDVLTNLPCTAVAPAVVMASLPFTVVVLAVAHILISEWRDVMMTVLIVVIGGSGRE